MNRTDPVVRVSLPSSLINRLRGLGPHLIRVAKRGKEPVDPGWTQAENMMDADDPGLQEWLEEGGNYGVVGGFGLAILDADTNELKELIKNKLPPTFTVESPGSRGWHLYFLCGLEKSIRLRDRDGENVGDVQGPGKMVVGPGCIHPNGGVYRIVRDATLALVSKKQLVTALGDYVVPETETRRIDELARKERCLARVNVNIMQVVPLAGLHKRGDEYYGAHPVHGSKTGRNFWVNPDRNVWHCFRHGTGGGPLLWLAVQEGVIRCEDATPGALRGDKFKKILAVAKERGFIDNSNAYEEPENNTKVDEIIRIAQDDIIALFHDDRGEPYAVVAGSDHHEIHSLTGRQFGRWLRNKYYRVEKRGLRRETVNDAVATLAAMAQFGDRSEERVLHNRVAWHDGAIYYDLADEKWRAIRASPDGWAVVNHPPPLFRRFQHQKAQTIPKSGGRLDGLFDFINVKDEGLRLVIQCVLVTALVPNIPHPVILLLGPQGCGKSLAMRILRALIDPSRIPLLSFNYDRAETALMLHQHYAPFFDNVSSITNWLSDVLCRASTGDGFTKRRLYTDEDAVILEFKRCVGINGIAVSADRADLQDRCVTVRLSQIPPEARREETEILKDFSDAHPYIFGAMLDALSKAMRIYLDVEIERLPRMADFARWGEAVARALGHQENEFLKAYEKVLGEQTLTVLEENPVGLAIIRFMETRESWSGSPSALLQELEQTASEHQIDARSKKWPGSASWLTRRIREIETNLQAEGITLDFGHAKDRTITIQKIGRKPSGDDGNDGNDDISRNTLGRHIDIKPRPSTQKGSGNTVDVVVASKKGPTDSEGGPVFGFEAQICEVCGKAVPEGNRFVITDAEGVHYYHVSCRRKLIKEGRIGRKSESVSGDLVSQLRTAFTRGTKRDIVDLCWKLRKWTEDEAGQLFERLRKEGELARDPDGYWRWTR